MPDYYLLRDNKTLGPYRAEDLRAWAAGGQLPATDLLCEVGAEKWAPLGDWPELASAAVATSVVRTGLSAWVTRGWEMVSTDVWPFVGATLLVTLLTLLTVGICGPPLNIGLWRMILKKHDGQAVATNDVFEGFRYFAPAWGLALITLLPLLVIMAPFALMAMPALRHGDAQQALAPLVMAFQFVMIVPAYLIGTILMFAMPLIADDRAGPVEAVVQSWETVKKSFWSYLGVYVICGLIMGAGAYACYVGMFFTIPVGQAGLAACYRERFPAKES
ncbi:MAG: GYF domain-containing protein [Armatimonadota bacterium]